MHKRINYLFLLYRALYERTRYFRFLTKRIIEDDIQLLASSLSFTTILSIVPVMAVLLSVFSLFPLFETLKLQLSEFILTHIMPLSEDIVKDYLNKFISNARQTTIFGLVLLFAISLLLIRRIDVILNKIWHTQRKRSKVTTFAVYWTVLTLGPILLGISVAISSFIATQKFFGENSWFHGFDVYALSFVPSILTFIILTLVFMAVPTSSVRFLHACAGAFVATVLQELLRKLFIFFITNFSNYAIIYGAIAAMPVLMIWTHINWFVVLLGAEISATIDVYTKEHNSFDKAE
jgi:membrane protein